LFKEEVLKIVQDCCPLMKLYSFSWSPPFFSVFSWSSKFEIFIMWFDSYLPLLRLHYGHVYYLLMLGFLLWSSIKIFGMLIDEPLLLNHENLNVNLKISCFVFVWITRSQLWVLTWFKCNLKRIKLVLVINNGHGHHFQDYNYPKLILSLPTYVNQITFQPPSNFLS
jgi:hypothetical protein